MKIIAMIDANILLFKLLLNFGVVSKRDVLSSSRKDEIHTFIRQQWGSKKSPIYRQLAMTNYGCEL